jgi:Flp pilus assembly protein TadB
MESEMIEEMIPIVMFIVTGIVFWLFFMYRHKTRAQKQQTIRLALEKGSELSPEFMKSLSDPEPPRNRDLRRGLIWMGMAVALALCGLATSFFSIESLYGCLAGAAFPFCIGAAYLIMWRYGSSETAAA